MINKINRLSKKKDIDAVYKQGRPVFTRTFSIKALPNQTDQKRFVVVVSTKVSKLATARNRIKRIIREIIVNNLLQIKSGQDYMIIIRPGQKILSQKEAEPELLLALKKLGCIKKAVTK